MTQSSLVALGCGIAQQHVGKAEEASADRVQEDAAIHLGNIPDLLTPSAVVQPRVVDTTASESSDPGEMHTNHCLWKTKTHASCLVGARCFLLAAMFVLTVLWALPPWMPPNSHLTWSQTDSKDLQHPRALAEKKSKAQESSSATSAARNSQYATQKKKRMQPHQHSGLESNVTREPETTQALTKTQVHDRKLFFGLLMAAFVSFLVFGGFAAFWIRRRAATNATEPEPTYIPVVQPEDSQRKATPRLSRLLGHEVGHEVAGLGSLSEEELKEMEEEYRVMEDGGSDQVSKDAQLAAWAQKHALALRDKFEAHLRCRFWIVLGCMGAYVFSAAGLPLMHADEATCNRGFFWETHIQFMLVFGVTKLIELWLCATDPTLQWDGAITDLFFKFVPSFLSYFDGYSDATSTIIAHSCPHPFAQSLSMWMGITYIIGVVVMQWVVLLYFASKDPSQACLLKLVHMDLLASCVTLPPDHKWTWDLISFVRTVGEDIPQAVLQTLYLVFVKWNPFVLISIIMGVLSSLKALYEARNRALAAAGAAAEFDQRKQETSLFSCSQDGTIRCWNARDGTCTLRIDCGSPANTICAVRGMLYSAHDDGLIREWDIATGGARRQFQHRGYGSVVATSSHLYSWFRTMNGSSSSVKEWSLESGETLQEVQAITSIFVVQIFIKARKLYMNGKDDPSSIDEYSLESAAHMRTYAGHTQCVNAIFATTRRLFSGSMDGTAKEWSLEAGTCTRTFDDHCTHENGSVLVVVKDLFYNGSDAEHSVNEWSLSTGQRLRTFAGHTDSITGLLLFENVLYSSSMDATIKMYSVETGECLRTFTGHTDYINNLVVEKRWDDD